MSIDRVNRIHYIYKITNLINGKIYIGQSVNPRVRWSDHKIEARKENPALVVNQAMKKYGVENFSFEVIASCVGQDAANDTETLLVEQEQSHVNFGKGYNVSKGGFNAPKTEEWKAKVRATRLAKDNYKQSEETRRKLSETWHANKEVNMAHMKKLHDAAIGRPCTEERRQKIAQANKGKQFCLGHVQPEEVIEKRKATNNAKYGEKVCSVEGCGRTDRVYKVNGIKYCMMHAQRVEKHGTPDEPMKQVVWNKGQPMTAEMREKLSQAAKGREAHNKGKSHRPETIEKLRQLNLGKEPPNKMKFTEEQILKIVSDPRGLRKIAKDFNVSTKVIQRIKKTNSIWV